MNIALLIIEIYLLIGLVTVLVFSLLDGREPCPRRWTFRRVGVKTIVRTIVAWPRVLFLIWLDGLLNG